MSNNRFIKSSTIIFIFLEVFLLYEVELASDGLAFF